MTGYQEVMTDPSYARQVIAFTFPHIGNVGANDEDVEAGEAHALGCLVREAVTAPSNFRAQQDFADWMAATGRIGISGVDTRALTRLVRARGAADRSPSRIMRKGKFDLDALQQMARGLAGARGHGPGQGGQPRRSWRRGAAASGSWGEGYRAWAADDECRSPHVVAIDYGAKRNIFRNLVEAGARVTVRAGDRDASTR